MLLFPAVSLSLFLSLSSSFCPMYHTSVLVCGWLMVTWRSFSWWEVTMKDLAAGQKALPPTLCCLSSLQWPDLGYFCCCCCPYAVGKNLSLPNYFFWYSSGNAFFLCDISGHWSLQGSLPWLASLWDPVSPPSALHQPSIFVFSRLCLGYHSFVSSGLPLACLHSFFASPLPPLLGVCFLRPTQALACHSAAVPENTRQDIKSGKRKLPVTSQGCCHS